MKLAALLVSCATVWAQIQLTPIAGGLDQPLAIVDANDGSGRLFILEQRGRVRVYQNGAVQPTPVLDIADRISCCGERGLLGIAFPKGFTEKRHFYVNYTNRQGHTIVSRFRLTDANIADPGSETQVLQVEQPFSNHNGGHLLFHPDDGLLYIGLGDGGSGGDPQNNAQRGDSLLGKMLRIDVESGTAPYAIPPSNPFVSNSSFKPEIWAYGLRNPWRYSFDRQTKDLWIADVGQNRAEEVHLQPASSRGGENYGWRKMEGLQCYESNCDRTGLQIPVLEYTRDQGVSVTGGFIYRGARWPQLNGTYIYADYGSGRIWGLRREGSEWRNTLLLASGFSISTFGEDEQGELYLADHGRGNIHLITAGLPLFTAAGVVNAIDYSAGLPGSGIASVFGAGITAMRGIAVAGRRVTELAGSSVTVNGLPAPVLAVANVNGQEQINFETTGLTPGSRASVVVKVNSQTSAEVQVDVK